MNLLVDHLLIFLIAILIDVTVGDPPERVEKFYPIVWISRLAYFFDRMTKRGNEGKEKALGIVYPLLIILIFTLPCLLLPLIPSELLYILLGSLIFKMTFTIKGLERYGRKTIEAGDLEEKRKAVGKIVSRDVADLDVVHLNSAAVESVAENITDSVISPLFYFSFLGVLGAMLYRVINTLDAVFGYKDRRYVHFGWFSAKIDDLMNYIPERITAGLILLFGESRSALRGLKDWGNERSAPLTIVAMSHALRVRLEKPGYYIVGEGFGNAREEHIEGAIRIMRRSTFFFAFICLMVMVSLYFGGWDWFKGFL